MQWKLTDDRPIWMQLTEQLTERIVSGLYPLGSRMPSVRELLTFSMLLTLGGCESQLRSHIQGNLNVGNDKRTMLAVVTQLLPYAGYPRTLNAIACLNEAIPENE